MAAVKSIVQLFTVLESAPLVSCTVKLLVDDCGTNIKSLMVTCFAPSSKINERLPVAVVEVIVSPFPLKVIVLVALVPVIGVMVTCSL